MNWIEVSLFIGLICISLIPNSYAQLTDLGDSLIESRDSLAVEGDPLRLRLFLDGNVKTSSVESDGESGTATGFIGISVQTDKRAEWTALVSVASSVDTLKEGFGTSLLNPATGGKAFQVSSGLVHYKRRKIWTPPDGTERGTGRRFNFGLQGYISVSKNLWSIYDKAVENAANEDMTLRSYLDALSIESTVEEAVFYAMGMSLFYEIIEEESYSKGGNSFTMNGELGVAIRGLGGDVVNSDRSGFRKVFVGNDFSYWRFGLDLGILLKFNSITAEAHTTVFPGQTLRKIDGLSGLQFWASISIQASIIEDTLMRKR